MKQRERRRIVAPEFDRSGFCPWLPHGRSPLRGCGARIRAPHTSLTVGGEL